MTGTGGFLQEKSEMNRKLLVRPDARIQNMESKIATLADQLSNLMLMMEKSHAAPSNGLLASESSKEDRNNWYSE